MVYRQHVRVTSPYEILAAAMSHCPWYTQNRSGGDWSPTVWRLKAMLQGHRLDGDFPLAIRTVGMKQPQAADIQRSISCPTRLLSLDAIDRPSRAKFVAGSQREQ
jgi:hypothetical protein